MKLLLIAILVLSIYAYNAYASEHTPWPMYKHDPQHTGQSPFNGSEENTLRWKFPTGERIQGSPAIAPDGTIYVGSHDSNLYAINQNGTEKWRFSAGRIDSTAAIASDGTIYFGSWDKNIYAISPAGKGKWRYPTADQISSSPAIAPDGTIYTGSDDGFLSSLQPNGNLNWVFKAKERIFSSPAIAPDGTIYVGSFDNNLYAINQNGTEKWRFETGGFVFSSPAIAPGGTVYFGSYDSHLYATYPNGTLKWSFKTESLVQGSPSIAPDGTIYVGSHDSNLYAINPDGTEKWRFKTHERIFSSPAIAPDGTIYVGSVDGNLYAIGIPTQSTDLLRFGRVDELVGYGGTELYVASTSVLSEKVAGDVSVEVVLKNIDSRPRSFDLQSFKLKGTNGIEFSPDPAKSTLKSVRIQSYDTVRGVLFFKSGNASVSQLLYHDDRGVKLTIDLTDAKVPADAEPKVLLKPGANVGKKIISNDLEMNILDEKFLESDPQQYIMRLSFINRGINEIKYNQTFAYVKDINGNVFLPDTSRQFSGTLAPSQSVTGEILFRVASNVGSVVFVYDDISTNSYITVPEFPLGIIAIAGALSLFVILSKFRIQKV